MLGCPQRPFLLIKNLNLIIKNKDLKSNYSNSSDSRNDNNNEWKYNCNNDNNIVDDKNNSSNINKKFFDNNNNDQKLQLRLNSIHSSFIPNRWLNK